MYDWKAVCPGLVTIWNLQQSLRAQETGLVNPATVPTTRAAATGTDCLGVGGIGVGGDGDTDLGESCSEEAESKGAEDDGFHFGDTARANIGIFQEAVPGEK